MVLAVGNSVGDWAANTAVSRDGHSEIGVASCFRSPLLNDVIGLSVALIVSGKNVWKYVKYFKWYENVN